MKIAVASSDGMSIAEHFGGSCCFIVFHVEDRAITGEEIRDNTFAGHGEGEYTGENDAHGLNGPNDHDGIAAALGDCNAVLARGMGGKAATALIAAGVTPFVLKEPLSPERAVELFVSGKLEAAGAFHRCDD